MSFKECIKHIFPASCHKLDCERDKILKEIDKSNTAAQQMSREITELRKLILDMKVVLEGYDCQVRVLKKDNQVLKELLESGISQNSEYAAKNDKYASQIDQNQNRMITGINDLLDTQKELKNQQKDLVNCQKKMTEYQKGLDEQQKNLNSRQKELNELQNQGQKYVREQFQVVRNKEQEIFVKARDNGRRLNTLDAVKRQLNAVEIMAGSRESGVNSETRTPRIIVSMTSYPTRIQAVPFAMERLMNQTVKPDKIVLWLSSEQFPNGEAELPLRLIEMKERGLEIEWCEGDLKAYKKLLPALKKYPEDLILTVDDDLFYDLDLVENLYEMHRRYPECIIASRAHKMTYDEEGNLQPYQAWEKEIDYDLNEPKENLFITTGAGTLFPPKSLDEEVFNEEAIRTLCPYADDIWVNAMAAIRGTGVMSTGKNCRLVYISGTQEDRLYNINKTENDSQLKDIIAYYGGKISWSEKSVM